MKLPIPKLESITSEWIALLVTGTLIGYRFREVVAKADPAHSLIAFDWGLFVGAGLFYIFKLLLTKT